MWNHSPRMWAEFKATQREPPPLTSPEAADLFAYFYATLYFAPQGDGVITFPRECEDVDCSLLAVLQADVGQCSVVNGDCICRTPASVTWSMQPYTVTGGQLTLQDGRSFDYCVQGDRLTYQETGMAQEPGTFLFDLLGALALCFKDFRQNIAETLTACAFENNEPPGKKFPMIRRAGTRLQDLRKLALGRPRRAHGLGRAGPAAPQQVQCIRGRQIENRGHGPL